MKTKNSEHKLVSQHFGVPGVESSFINRVDAESIFADFRNALPSHSPVVRPYHHCAVVAMRVSGRISIMFLQMSTASFSFRTWDQDADEPVRKKKAQRFHNESTSSDLCCTRSAPVTLSVSRRYHVSPISGMDGPLCAHICRRNKQAPSHPTRTPDCSSICLLHRLSETPS